MTPIRTFIIGSSAFFSGMEGYVPKDIDELNIMDEFPFYFNVLNGRKNGRDVFFYRNMNKEDFIKDTLKSGVTLRAGKFLVPEFAEYLGMTIRDLRKLHSFFNRMDEKHRYEGVIYRAYLENGDFYLTDEQRQAAYDEYKKARE